MGAFVLFRRARADEVTAALVTGSLERQGFRGPRRFVSPDAEVLVYPKRMTAGVEAVDAPSGDFCVATGTLVYRETTGGRALQRLLAEFTPAGIDPALLTGAFCLIVCKAGRTYLFGDPLGLYKVYRTESADVWSSSFLAAAAAVPRPRVDVQGVHEYVFQEATFGASTVLEDVRLAEPDALHEIAGTTLARRPLPGVLKAEVEPLPLEEHVARCLGRLRTVFAGLRASYGANVGSALSGGYDSRLMLALALEQGVTPSLHVYGRAGDPDVVIAKLVAAGEGLPLAHIDKSAWPVPSLDDAEPTVDANFQAFDGTPPTGIFDHGADLHTRCERSRDGQLNLNGGGGEIFRNFYYLRDRPYTVRQFLSSFYSRFDPATCRASFDEDAYLAALAAKVTGALGAAGERLSRAQVELTYPLFRCRYWTGRNVALNNRLGHDVTPFLDHALVARAVTIPLALKAYGDFEAALIRAVHPRLARYPSVYGHDFSRPAPWRRRRGDLASLWRPVRLRRYSYRLQARRRGPTRRAALSPPFLERVLDTSFPYLEAVFDVARVRDEDQLARICTLEYLFQRIKAAAIAP